MPSEGAPSDELLTNLHQSLGEAMRDPEFGSDFARITRALREKRYTRGEPEIREIAVDGRLRFRVDVGDRLGADVYFGSYREVFDIEAFCRMLAPGDTVVDVGANFGFLSITAADRVGSRGRVIAFEPDDHAHALMVENVKLNRLRGRIRVVHRCVSNEDGMVPFHRMRESAFSGMADTKRSSAKEVVMVQAQRLDTAAAEFRVRRIDALKIDVEGFEYAVLEGGLHILGRSPDPIVMFEVSRKNLDEARRGNFQRVVSGLLEHGWNVWTYDIKRDELVQAASADALIEGAGGNIFLAKSGSERLERLRAAYRDIVATKLLPTAVRRLTGMRAEGDQSEPPAHSLQRLLWSSFLQELSASQQQDRAKAQDEAARLRVRLEAIESALTYERAQRESAQQRAEQAGREAAQAVAQLTQAETEAKQLTAAHETARTALAHELQRAHAETLVEAQRQHDVTAAALRHEVEAASQKTASLEHDIRELHVIINQRDSARIRAEEERAAARSDLEQLRLSHQQLLEAEKARAAAVAAEVRQVHARLAESAATGAEQKRVLDAVAQTLRRELEEARAAGSQRDGTIEKLTSSLMERDRMLRALADEKRELAAGLQHTRESAEQARLAAAGERKALETHLAQVTGELREARLAAESTAAKLAQARATHEQSLAAHQKIVRELNSTIERIDAEVRQYRQTEKTLAAQGNELRGLCERLTLELTEERARVAEERKQEQQAGAEAAAAAAADFARVSAELQSALAEIHDARKTEAGLRAHNATIEDARNELQRILDATLGRKLRRWIGRPPS